MTEDEARNKWCPMVRADVRTKVDTCIASDCAMWVQTDNECQPVPGDYEGAAVCLPAGYCGLTRG